MRNSVTAVGLLQAAAFLTILFSVVTAFDSIHHGVELFSHFRMQYLVVAAVLTMLFALLRSPKYAAALLMTTILNATFVLPWYFAEAPAATGVSLKLMHANVHSTNTAHQRLLDLVAEENPDIIFLQEVTGEWAQATQGLRAEYPFIYVESREDNFGISMFSRFPVDAVTHVDSPPLGYPTIIAKTGLHGRQLTLISTHPTIPLGRGGYDARNVQLDSVVTLVSDAEGPVILVGDLNTGIWSGSYRKLQANTGLRNARRGFGVIPTWPTFMPFAMIGIDHALVSPDLGIVDIHRGRRIGSDHLALIVTVAL